MLAGRLNLAKGSSGLKLWEKKHPEAAPALCEVAARRAQQDPTLRTIVTVHPLEIGGEGRRRRVRTVPRVVTDLRCGAACSEGSRRTWQVLLLNMLRM